MSFPVSSRVLFVPFTWKLSLAVYAHPRLLPATLQKPAIVSWSVLVLRSSVQKTLHRVSNDSSHPASPVSTASGEYGRAEASILATPEAGILPSMQRRLASSFGTSQGPAPTGNLVLISSAFRYALTQYQHPRVHVTDTFITDPLVAAGVIPTSSLLRRRYYLISGASVRQSPYPQRSTLARRCTWFRRLTPSIEQNRAAPFSGLASRAQGNGPLQGLLEASPAADSVSMKLSASVAVSARRTGVEASWTVPSAGSCGRCDAGLLSVRALSMCEEGHV